MFFTRTVTTSSILALISILSMAFKEFILNKQSYPFIDLLIVISTILFFTSMIVSLISFFVQRKNNEAKNYHVMFYVLLVCVPLFIVYLNIYK